MTSILDSFNRLVSIRHTQIIEFPSSMFSTSLTFGFESFPDSVDTSVTLYIYNYMQLERSFKICAKVVQMRDMKEAINFIIYRDISDESRLLFTKGKVSKIKYYPRG